MKLFKILCSGFCLIIACGTVTNAHNNDNQEVLKAQESEKSAENSFLEALQAMKAGPKSGQADSINNFFQFYNLHEFSSIYSNLIDSKIKPLKSENHFLSILSEIKGYTGDYIRGNQTGMAFGMQTVINDDKGIPLSSAISFQTSTINWQATFENTILYFEFIFVNGETDTKLYLVKIADDQMSSDFKRNL
jgi:hypothetical protein